MSNAKVRARRRRRAKAAAQQDEDRALLEAFYDDVYAGFYDSEDPNTYFNAYGLGYE